ncbi:hypothetical protein TEA_008002 [Camellia sinensis var. sinensis]|uniref:DNA topoisomerase (ATP-hydrolyzing) n=1 Tax=Camellia sinensis var. sinensis TaxID=542762 RepID=A0A4S4DTS8_CAMSN|nr:hypothetical protein TEA_008002 [Camellia sinensis var. sinensis]
MLNRCDLAGCRCCLVVLLCVVATMAASSVVCTWLVAACMSVACEKDQQQQPMMMMMNQSSSKRFSRWARKRRVLSKCRAGCSEIPKGRLISSGIQGLMSSYVPFEPCNECYSSKGLCSSDFFGDNGFSSLFGSTNVPLSRRQRRFNRAVHFDASDNDTNSGSGILFEDKICVKHWHCPWGSTVVDYIAPVFRLILEENYLSSPMQPLEDTKKNRSLWWMQRKSLDQRLGKFLRDLEDSWFGPIVQFLLLGEWSGCEHQESQKKLMHNLKVKCKVDAHESLIKVIIGGAKHICEREESILQLILNKGCFIDGVGYCNQERWGTYADTSDGFESLSKKALKLILEAAREVEEEECLNREPVILVLDFDVQGGKDHASARYIYTWLSPITRFMFPKDDDILLDYLNEDGQSIEPVWYMPVIPLVLVNGSEDVWYCGAFLSVQMFGTVV